MLACAAPRCSRETYARGYCRGHYVRVLRAGLRGQPPDLSPLRDPEAEAREVLSMRVTSPTKARATLDPEGARNAVERWARRHR